MSNAPITYAPPGLIRTGAQRWGFLLLLLNGLLTILLALGLTVFVIYAFVVADSRDRVVSRSDFPLFIGLAIGVTLLFWGIGLAEAVCAFLVRKGSTGGSVLAILATLLHLLIAVGFIVLGVLIIVNNTDEVGAIITGGVLIAVGLLLSLLLLVQLVLAFKSMAGRKNAKLPGGISAAAGTPAIGQPPQ